MYFAHDICSLLSLHSKIAKPGFLRFDLMYQACVRTPLKPENVGLQWACCLVLTENAFLQLHPLTERGCRYILPPSLVKHANSKDQHTHAECSLVKQ